MRNFQHLRTRALIVAALLSGAPACLAQTSSGTINAQLVYVGGIALVFNQDPGGATLTGAGGSNATINYGNISAYGPLSAGVTRTSVTASNFTVRSIFDVQVDAGGLVFSNNYNLSANLASAAPTGMTYRIDGYTMTTTAQTIQTAAAYSSNIPHNLDLTVSTASPGAGGPTTGTPVTTVINFTATAN